MKLPPPIIKYLKGKKILKPTPIQIQGIPTAYVNRPFVVSRYSLRLGVASFADLMHISHSSVHSQLLGP